MERPGDEATMSVEAWRSWVDQRAAELIGRPDTEALAEAHAAGVNARLIRTEGGYAITLEYIHGRMNLYSSDGLVVRVDAG